MNDENTSHENAKAAAKYTPLSFRRVDEIINDAADDGFRDIDLAERVREEAEIEESEDYPSTWFVEFHAKTWREAAAFTAAVVGAAFAQGLFAEASSGWGIGLERADGGRLVDVFVASADFMTDDGKPVVG